jgi:hypothetical protein
LNGKEGSRVEADGVRPTTLKLTMKGHSAKRNTRSRDHMCSTATS